MGRADQTTKIRGMFVRPEQVATLVKRFDEVSKARLVVISDGGQDRMILRCEASGEHSGLSDRVADAIRQICALRGEVEFVAPGTLADDGKVIEDQRPVG